MNDRIPGSSPWNPIIYRSFNIALASYSPHPSEDFEWWHEDFDGPGDSRCGRASSLAKCKSEIDDWIKDNT